MKELLEKILSEADARTIGWGAAIGVAGAIGESASAWIDGLSSTGLLPLLGPSEVGVLAGMMAIGVRLILRDRQSSRRHELGKRDFLEHEEDFLRRLRHVATYVEWNSVEFFLDRRNAGQISNDQLAEHVLSLLEKYGLME